LIPQGSGTIAADAGEMSIALRPAIPAAAPRKLRREGSIFMDTLLLLVNVNSTP
jgi:hypothetical protein